MLLFHFNCCVQEAWFSGKSVSSGSELDGLLSAESLRNWRIGCQLPLPALASNRNWLCSSVCLCVCARCQREDWATSPGAAEPRCSSMNNTMSACKHRGTDKQMERDWYQRAHLLSTCPIRLWHTDYRRSSCKHMHPPKKPKLVHAHISQWGYATVLCAEPLSGIKLLLSLLQLFTFPLPSSDLPLTSSVSVSLGSASGIKRAMGGCDLQQNPLSLALPHTSQSTGEVLIHRTAQSC